MFPLFYGIPRSGSILRGHLVDVSGGCLAEQ